MSLDPIDRAHCHVVRHSEFNPMGWAVEMEDEEFCELLNYATELREENRTMKRQNNFVTWIVVAMLWGSIITFGFIAIKLPPATATATEMIARAPWIPPAERCWHLYNVGKSREWQDCMGIGPK